MKSLLLFLAFIIPAMLLTHFDGVDGTPGVALGIVYGLVAGALSAVFSKR